LATLTFGRVEPEARTDYPVHAVTVSLSFCTQRRRRNSAKYCRLTNCSRMLSTPNPQNVRHSLVSSFLVTESEQVRLQGNPWKGYRVDRIGRGSYLTYAHAGSISSTCLPIEQELGKQNLAPASRLAIAAGPRESIGSKCFPDCIWACELTWLKMPLENALT
jgi:hypothetical protein